MSSLDLAVDEVRALHARIAALAAGYLDSLPARPAFPATSGAETERLFGGPAPEQGTGIAALDLLPAVLDHSRAPTGRFFGYVHGSGEPVSAAADLLASTVNQNVTAWRSAPAAVTIERTVVSWLADAIGCAGFAGSLCGGGSAANLMGLAMAREARGRGQIYLSEQAHMSIPKAAALLGLARAAVRRIPTDGGLRMRPDALAAALEQDRRAGRAPTAVIATAGTVATGAIDPLAEIASIARRYGAWLHVDGAYGALAALAAPEKLAGLQLADSLSLDPHKWLYQPTACGCLLYRDAARARAAFSQTGDYAQVLNADPVEGFAFFEESLELSRRFRALGLWLSLRYHGLAAFRRAIAGDLAHARALADAVDAEPALERLAPVPLSAVVFRVRAADDAGNRAILARVIARGRIYLSNASVRGHFGLRACFVNHRTGDADVAAIVPEVMAAAG